MANMYGMHAARAAKLGLAVKREGMQQGSGGRQLVGFCSADSHYSYTKVRPARVPSSRPAEGWRLSRVSGSSAASV